MNVHTVENEYIQRRENAVYCVRTGTRNVIRHGKAMYYYQKNRVGMNNAVKNEESRV